MMLRPRVRRNLDIEQILVATQHHGSCPVRTLEGMHSGSFITCAVTSNGLVVAPNSGTRAFSTSSVSGRMMGYASVLSVVTQPRP